MTSTLIACGNREGNGDGGQQADPATNTPAITAGDEAAERYREKVDRRVSASVVISFVISLSREWGIPEANVECLLADLRATQLADASSDATVAAVFDKCGVDPGVID